MPVADADTREDRWETGPASRAELIAGYLAVCGGLLTLAVALLATASVFMRWILGAPIEGDFEFVKMATAIAVFSYLPYTQVRRGNIMADTFTFWLPARATSLMDAFWDLVYAGVTGFLAYALMNGTLDAFRSGETTMERQIKIWPSIGLSSALCLVLAVIAVVTAMSILKSSTSRRGT